MSRAETLTTRDKTGRAGARQAFQSARSVDLERHSTETTH
jgi:hypothetical protein